MTAALILSIALSISMFASQQAQGAARYITADTPGAYAALLGASHV